VTKLVVEESPGQVTVLHERTEIHRLLNGLLYSARRRAAKAGIAFALAPRDIETLWDHQRGRCAVSGLRFSLLRFPRALVKHPYGPSLDRIDAQDGCTRVNVRLVCTAVNFGLGEWGDEVFIPIAEATTRRQAAIRASGREQLDKRIGIAESVLQLLSPANAQKQRRRIAALKRARTLGPLGLAAAATKARESRRSRRLVLARTGA
jgi:hypothetical protein